MRQPDVLRYAAMSRPGQYDLPRAPAPARREPGIALAPALGYVLGMENNHPIATEGSRAARPASKRFSEVPLADKLADVIHWLEEHKGGNIVSIDLAAQNGFADALVVVTAGSARHAQSLADGVAALCHERNYEFLRIEGYEAGQWILVDMNDIVVNIFLGPVRELYGLETLWGHVSTSTPLAPMERAAHGGLETDGI